MAGPFGVNVFFRHPVTRQLHLRTETMCFSIPEIALLDNVALPDIQLHEPCTVNTGRVCRHEYGEPFARQTRRGDEICDIFHTCKLCDMTHIVRRAQHGNNIRHDTK